jgi:hypothetical protein
MQRHCPAAALPNRVMLRFPAPRGPISPGAMSCLFVFPLRGELLSLPVASYTLNE